MDAPRQPQLRPVIAGLDPAIHSSAASACRQLRWKGPMASLTPVLPQANAVWIARSSRAMTECEAKWGETRKPVIAGLDPAIHSSAVAVF